MGFAMFMGCTFFVLGPLVVLFSSFISEHSQLVILSIGSAFFWLLSILLTSMFWYVVSPLRDTFYFIVPFAVVFQEAVRFLFWFVYNKVYNHSEFKDDITKPSDFAASFAIGWGSSAAMTFVMHISLLWSSFGPGDLPNPNCPSVSSFHLHAILILGMAVLNIILSILLFEAYSTRSYLMIAIGILFHFAAAMSSVFNQKVNCVAGTLIPWLVILCAAGLTFYLMIFKRNTLIRYKKTI